MKVDNREYIEKMDFALRFAEKETSDFTSQDIKDIWDYAMTHYKNRYWNDMVHGVSNDMGLSSKQTKFVWSIIKGWGGIGDFQNLKNQCNKLALAVYKAKMYIKAAGYPIIIRWVVYIPMYANHWLKTTFKP